MADIASELLKNFFTLAEQSADGLKHANEAARRLKKFSTRLSEDLEEIGTEAASLAAAEAAKRPSYEMNIIEDTTDFEKPARACLELIEKAAKDLQECLASFIESKTELQTGIAAIDAEHAKEPSPEVAEALAKFDELIENSKQ